MHNQSITANNIQLNVVIDGPEDGPLVILLHGFPEFWYGWRNQIPYLASKGFRVWAPDQRGYNLSDKPNRIEDYNLDILADDVIALIEAAGEEQTFLVGHDWGGAVAWWVAAKYPEKVKKLVILNSPHNSVMSKHLRNNKVQRRKSWYFYFFQIPWLPEFILKLNNCWMTKTILKNSSQPGTFSEEELKIYCQAWQQPKAYKSMINWYRAIIQKPPTSRVRRQVTVPTMMIWGLKDTVFGPEMAQQSIDLCDEGKLFELDEQTHWVHHEAPDQVNELIGKFLDE